MKRLMMLMLVISSFSFATDRKECRKKGFGYDKKKKECTEKVHVFKKACELAKGKYKDGRCKNVPFIDKLKDLRDERRLCKNICGKFNPIKKTCKLIEDPLKCAKKDKKAMIKKVKKEMKKIYKKYETFEAWDKEINNGSSIKTTDFEVRKCSISLSTVLPHYQFLICAMKKDANGAGCFSDKHKSMKGKLKGEVTLKSAFIRGKHKKKVYKALGNYLVNNCIFDEK